MHAGTGEPVRASVVPDRMVSFLWVLVLIAALFGILILFVGPDTVNTYHFFSNSFQGVIALVCMICCLYAYRTWSERVILVLAAFAFGGYALSNTFWYLYNNSPLKTDAPFSIADLGFLGFMLFFVVAFRIEFQKKPCPVPARIASGALFLFLALVTLGIAHVTPSTAVSLVWLLVMALFIDAALDHGVYRYPLFWRGICLWCFALISYELWNNVITRFVARDGQIPFAPGLLTWDGFFYILIGPLIILSFLLIQLGMFAYLNSFGD
jgi:hypothetical protein